jgi:hypothetical protein
MYISAAIHVARNHTMIEANQLTFGVEIETIAPASAVAHDGLRIGSYRHGIQVPYLPPGWTAERDGSIRAIDGGHTCEIVSPVLQGAEGLAQVAEVLRTLQAKNHRVNGSTGVMCMSGGNATGPARPWPDW